MSRILAIVGAVLLLGAAQPAHASLTLNSLTANSLTANALTANSLTANAIVSNALVANALATTGAVAELNGVAVVSVVLPPASRP